MAGADYTTILMKNGKLMLFPLMDKTAMARGYVLGAIKSHFEISRKSKETHLSKDLEDWFENDYDPAVRKSVLKAEDVFHENSWNVYGLLFDDGTAACMTLDCPEMNGAAIAYVLQKKSLSIMIAGGNNRQSDPWLHVLSRNISNAATKELSKELWKEVTDPWFFQKLFGEWKRFEIRPNLPDNGMKIDDPTFRKVFETLQDMHKEGGDAHEETIRHR